MINQKYVKEAFDYDPVTGILTWKQRPRHHFNTDRGWKLCNTKFAGKPCGNLSGCGYMTVEIAGVSFRLHRVIWLWCHGTLPEMVDHLNHDKLDNRIHMLRAASRTQNMHNTLKRQNCSSALKGVRWSKTSKKWVSSIRIDKRLHHLGYFDTEQEAHAAYCAKGRELFGEFFNPGY